MVRNIQIDLKYKVLLLADITWLVIDIFAFTLLGGMVDNATDVTYAMDINADVVNDTLEFYIYDVNGNYFYGSDESITIMEHVGKGKFEKMDGLTKYPDLTISINGETILHWTANQTDRMKNESLRFNGKKFILDLADVSTILDTTDFENEMEIQYVHEGDSKDRIEEETYFSFENFYYLPPGMTPSSYHVIADVNLESVMGEEGLFITVKGNDGLPVVNASVYIDGEFEGKTDEKGRFSWEENGDEIVHYRNKGTHQFRIKYIVGNETAFEKGEFLLGSPKNRLGIDYDLKNFLLVGVLFWAFFAKSYEDTVNTIPEEASRGTIGFLVTNNVNISTLLLSRNVASSIKTFLITSIFIIPPFIWLGVFAGFTWADLPILLLVFGLMWFFMLIISILVSSLNIIFKKITPVALMIIYSLKVLTGYYFPLEALDEYSPGLSDTMKKIPLVRGAYFIRDVIIIGKDAGEAWDDIQYMFVVTMGMAILTFLFYKFLEHKSQRWGTLEFY